MFYNKYFLVITMKFKFSHSILSIIFCSIFMVSLLQASQDVFDVDNILTSDQKSKVLSILYDSPESMYEDREKIRKGEFQELTTSIYLLSLTTTYSPVSMGDIERFLYIYCMARSNHFTNLAEGQNSLDPESATLNYKHAIEALLLYRSECFPLNSQNKSRQTTFYYHRLRVMQCLRLACKNIQALNQVEPDVSLLVPLLNLCIAACEESISLQKIIQTTHKVKGITKSEYVQSVQSIKMSQFSCYVNLARFVPQLRRESIKKANIIKKYFKSQKLRKSEGLCRRRLSLYAKSLELEKLNIKAAMGNESKRVKELRDQKYSELLSEQNSEFQSLLQTNGVSPELPHVKIQREFQILMQQDIKNPEFWNNFKTSIESIEAQVVSSYAVSANDFEGIYRNLYKIMPGDRLISLAPVLIATALVKCGNVEGALARIEALKKVHNSAKGNISGLLRVVSAILHNLNGDPTEWLDLEKKSDQIRAKERAKKIKKAKRRDEKKVARIKESVESNRQKELEQQNKHAGVEPPKKKVSELAPPNSHTMEADELSPFDSFPALSIEEEKSAKLERHRLAVKSRTEQKANSLHMPRKGKHTVSLSPVRQPTDAEKLEKINSSSTATICELFELSGVALEVDTEIEADSWHITREQLKIYFEAMGCSYVNGKGSHKKIALPKCVHVYHGKNLITIMNDFGGALTLPNWEKGYVPQYLKKQIQVSRLKLRALKLRVEARS